MNARLFLFASATLVLAAAMPTQALAQPHQLEDPVPPGAKGLVLSISGSVSPIRGLANDLPATSGATQTALQQLGANVIGKQIEIALPADALFERDKAELRADAGTALDKVLQILKSHPQGSAAIDSYLDRKGADTTKLSQQRAQAVRAWLAGNGATLRMSTRGLGSVAASGTRPTGAQQGSRIEIVVKTL